MAGLTVHYEVLNQLNTPTLYADTLLNRPAPAIVGRIFFRSDSPYGIYRDNGTSWDLISNVDTNVITGGGTTGQVSYFSGTNVIAGNNNLFWDAANNRLGIGTTTPGVPLDVHGTGTNIQMNGTGTNNAFAVFQNAGTNKWRIGNNYSTGTNYFSIYDTTNAVETLKITPGATNTILFTGNLTATSLIKSGGTSAQILAADGSVITAGTGISISSGTISSTFTLAIGSSITSATAGSILFAGTSGVLAQNNTNFFWDNTNLRLGIGTTTPSYNIDVTGTSRIQGNLFATAKFIAGTTTATSTRVITAYTTTAASQILAVGTTPSIGFSDGFTGGTFLSAVGCATATNDYVTGTASGDMVVINQTAAKRVYVVSSSAGVYLTAGATTWTANSDIRLKNINYFIIDALEKIKNLSVINYHLKDDINKKQQIGLIAQEVNEVLPEIVETSEQGILGIRYTELIPIIIKAIQEQQILINSLIK